MRRTTPKNAGQRELGFAEAEGSLQERRSLLIAAFRKVGDGDGRKCLRLAHKYALERIFHITHGGTPGETVKRTHAQIASEWLECHEETARRTMQELTAADLVETTAQLTQNGREANSYSIHWPGVYAVLGITRPASEPPKSLPQKTLGPTPVNYPGAPGYFTPVPPGNLPRCPGVFYPGAPGQNAGASKERDASCCSLVPLVVDDGVEREISNRWGEVSALTKRALAVAWPDQTADVDSRRLVLSAAIVAIMRVNEEWLIGAARITRQCAKTNPRAFLRRTLANRLAEGEGICGPDDAESLLNDLILSVRPIVAKVIGPKPSPQTTEP